MGDRDVERLLGDAGIVRHRAKIESTINNARRAMELAEREGSLARFFWSFEPTPAERPRQVTWDWIRENPKTETSSSISKELKRRGWSFVGPTTVYAFMQAVGLVNDHVEGCCRRIPCEDERQRFVHP